MKTFCVLLFAVIGYGLPFSASFAETILPKIEILHMWRTASERHAFEVFRDLLRNQPVQWLDYAVEDNFPGIQLEFSRRMSIQSAPNIVQWIISADMARGVESGTFQLIADKQGFLKKYLDPEIYSLVKMDGGVSGIPVGIHTQNHIVYNAEILEENNLEPASSWRQLISYGPLLKKKGLYLIGVSNEEWQLRNLFISILSSQLSYQDFVDLQTASHPVAHLEKPVSASISILSQLRKFANLDYHGKRWESISELVYRKKALAQILGDYVIAEFPERGKIHCGPTPQARYILWGIDGFVFSNTTDPALVQGQQAFLQAMLSETALLEYFRRKGGLPVLANVSRNDVDPCLLDVMKNWSKPESRIWMGGETWQKRLSVIGVFMKQEWEQADPSPINAARRLLQMLGAL